jgi:hypothetical protein
MHAKPTDNVGKRHLNTRLILRDFILTGFGIRIYDPGKIRGTSMGKGKGTTG